MRTLRFDTALAGDFHGYDVDMCIQARYHGRRVDVIDLPAEHVHRPLFDDSDAWTRNDLRFRLRWIDHRAWSPTAVTTRSGATDHEPRRAVSSATRRSTRPSTPARSCTASAAICDARPSKSTRRASESARSISS